VLITSGDIYYASGPNITTSGGWDNLLPGDPDLDVLAGTFTYDATTLEFDFTIPSDTIKFRYVFASEEYNEYVCADYNDVFGFFISGPGIIGTKNIARLPGSGLPVAINNVNNGTMGIYGGTATCYFSNTGYYIDNENPPGSTIEYDGFTTVLQAVAAVIPYQTYHIKLAVADATDYSLDSGVFIEAESFTGLPLPVELLSFIAEMRNNMVELKWATASEKNSSHFDVQRSADGHNFEFVDRVEAAGISSTAHNYHSVDYRPLQTQAYYRLKQTDFNGSVSYSKIVSVNSDIDNSVSVHPNPTAKEIVCDIAADREENIPVEIINVFGQIVFSKYQPITKGMNHLTLNMENFSSGIYTVKINKNNIDTRVKVLKKSY
jgi:hypothetical protein